MVREFEGKTENEAIAYNGYPKFRTNELDIEIVDSKKSLLKREC